MDDLLIVNNLCKTFKLSPKQQRIEGTKQKTAVDDLSFTAKRGEIFGLLGPNGAGKTTTLRILSTLIRPDSGNAFFDGVSVVDEPEKVRSKIAFLTSELKLEDFFTPNYLFDFF
ncbi:MAG: ATP-binding cassette domain-containing protein, partial [Salinivirgaceae bacterium]|nr:ATP-binding cassette domain-containing protein [Salinivirgaceae bacterium]